jgi:DMSO/TMAO reductase YedYZ molybdopterin-dependent catalytic subunit
MANDHGIRYSPDTQRAVRLPPGQHEARELPVLHTDGPPRINITQWEFTISGLVRPEISLRFPEFSQLPQVQVMSDIHCVTSWSRLDNLWAGVATTILRDLVSISPQAAFVIVHAAGGFTANLTVSDFFQPDNLFALNHNGKPITPEHGYPVRLVVPRLYFWKSVKWVTGVEFTATDRRGFWESRGYHNHGDPWQEERYSGQE